MYIFMYVSGVRVQFWSTGGTALRTNVAGRIGLYIFLDEVEEQT